MTLRLLPSHSCIPVVGSRSPAERRGAEAAELRRGETGEAHQKVGADGSAKLCVSPRSPRLCVKVRPNFATGLRLGLLLLLAARVVCAQTAADFFHGGAVNYLSNNIPKALEVVTNARALFPDDMKLKKLEELLKQQNQSQQQQQKEQQKQDEKKDQQSKPDPKDEKQPPQDKPQPDPQPEKPKPEEKKTGEPQPATAHAMTPQEAKQLLDAQKGDEKVLQFAPQGEQKQRAKTLKDW